jgi:hypothetical protein
VVLCLPERCARIAVTTGFRTVAADPTLPTTARIVLADQHQVAAPATGQFVLYALHRDEVPFMSHALQDLPGDDAVRMAVPVIVKGMGFGRKLQLWTARCLGAVGIGSGKKDKKERKKKEKKVKKSKADRHTLTATSKKSAVQDAPPSRNSH